MDCVPLELITYEGGRFALAVPSDWVRLATADHLAVFLDNMEVSGASITVSRHGLVAAEAAGAAAADHHSRFPSYRLDHESVGRNAVYRRFRWRQEDGTGIVQSQLFVDGLVVTCSRNEDQVGLDRLFGQVIQSFRIRTEGILQIEES